MSQKYGSHALKQIFSFSNTSEHGWSQLGGIIWMEEALPENISDILISSDDEDDKEEGRI